MAPRSQDSSPDRSERARLDPDTYLSIEDGPEIEIKVKGSSFLGQAFRADDLETATVRLRGVTKRFHDATHHCSAFRVGNPESFVERSDDNGEPSGTAGVPILGAIRRADVHGVILVVTRYYGGTKLGTGGLVRAYGDAAREAIEAAPRRTLWWESRIEVSCSYDDLGSLEAIVARDAESIRRIERDFSGEPRFDLVLRRSRTADFTAKIIEGTAGRARIRKPDSGD